MGRFENVGEVLSFRVLQISVIKSYLLMYLIYILGIAYKKSYPYIDRCAFYSELKMKSFEV